MGKQPKNKAKATSKAGPPPNAAIAEENAFAETQDSTVSPGIAADDLVFEDEFEDEFEPEAVDDEEDGDESKAASMDVDGEEGSEAPKKVYRPGMEGEEKVEGGLEVDSSAYKMYHSLRPEWPCLSFDILRDSMGTNRARFPHTVFAVAGTQADNPNKNSVTVMKLYDLHRTQRQEDEESDSDSDSDEEDKEPGLAFANIQHKGGVNRIRSMPQRPSVVASWSETGKVHVWDVAPQLAALNKGAGSNKPQHQQPAFTFSGHADEGFAMDWSPVEAGQMVTGDNAGHIHLWKPTPGGDWAVEPESFPGHSAGVEDLQWSPTEATVFASASGDCTVRIWDTRRKSAHMLSMRAHEEDINVITWNRHVAYLLASGSDDGSFKIWDLRAFGKSEPVAQFRWHQKPITSIEWHATDESMLAVAGADNQLTLWDLSVEADDANEASREESLRGLPPQLLFIHQGQTDIKELHFHPQIPGVIMSTAADGFNVFQPATTV